MKNKFILLISLIFILSFSFAQAYILFCLGDGEQLPPGCEDDPDQDCMFECEHTLCQICTTDEGIPGVNPSHCNDMACSFLGGDGSPDVDPPVLTLTNPVNEETYGSKRVYITLDVEPSARIQIRDNIDGGGWRTVTTGKVTSYNRKRSFDEGINDVTIRAKRDNGLTDEQDVIFYVDSKDPQVKKVYPYNEDYLNGEFSVEYTELNLNKVEFHHKGSDEPTWNIQEVPGCESGDRVTCDLTVDLSPYEGLEVDYKFLVYDSANFDDSRVYTAAVDTIDPILTINTPFESGYSEKKILFDLSSSEYVDFFYIDNNDERNRHKRIGKGLDVNKLVSFRDGQWDITIYAEDDAGNFDYENVIFFVDTKKPKIKKLTPRNRKWVNAEGLVTVEYDETNLAEDGIKVYYGPTGIENEVILQNCPNGKKQTCSTNIDFSPYGGQTINAYATIDDGYNLVSNRMQEWNVDTTVPEFVDGFGVESITVEDDIVTFDLKTTEEVDFLYKETSSDRYKNLCRGKDYCDRSKRFRDPGTYDLEIIDDAENFYVEQFIV